MMEKDFQILMDLATKMLSEKRTKEESRRNLVRAGILTPDGEFTKPYEHLTAACFQKDFGSFSTKDEM